MSDAGPHHQEVPQPAAVRHGQQRLHHAGRRQADGAGQHRLPGHRRQDRRRPDARDPAADHPRRGRRRRADVQLRDARADDPFLRQRAADDHGPVHGAERQGVPGDPEEAAGPGEAGLRRQDDADARPVEAVHADAGAGDAGHARQLPRAERQAVHGHAAAHAGPDARHVHRVPVSQLRRNAATAPTTTRSADARSAAASRVVALHLLRRVTIAAAAPCRPMHDHSPSRTSQVRRAPPRASASSRSAARRRWSTPSRSSRSCAPRATRSRPTTTAPTSSSSTPAASSTPPSRNRSTPSARRSPRTAR